MSGIEQFHGGGDPYRLVYGLYVDLLALDRAQLGRDGVTFDQADCARNLVLDHSHRLRCITSWLRTAHLAELGALQDRVLLGMDASGVSIELGRIREAGLRQVKDLDVLERAMAKVWADPPPSEVPEAFRTAMERVIEDAKQEVEGGV